MATPKWYCLNSYIHDEVKASRDRKMQVVQKLGAVAKSKIKKPAAKPSRKRGLVPEPLEGPRSSSWRPQPSPPSVPPPAHLTVLEPPAPPVPLPSPPVPLPPWRTTPPAPPSPPSPPSPPAPPAPPAPLISPSVALISLEQCSKPLLVDVDDDRGLYYPIYWGF